MINYSYYLMESESQIYRIGKKNNIFFFPVKTFKPQGIIFT